MISRCKILLAIVFAISASIGLHAQTHYEGTVALGVKGGMETSHVFFTPVVEQGMPLGVNGGIMFRYIEENHFGLIAECNFAQRGWKEDFAGTEYKYTRTLNYLEIPALAHIYFGGRSRFFINLGPQISVYLNDAVNSNFDVNKISELPGFPTKNRQLAQLTLPVANKVDYGITAGVGGEYNINEYNALSLELRGYFGLTNVFADGRRDAFRGSNQLSVALTAGYWFRVK